MAEFNVEIGAVNKKLNEKLKQSSEEIKNFSNKADKELKSIGKSSNTAAEGMANLNKRTINGNSAMTAFSRGIQDLPFGIMGVSNNITNLTEQFGYLKDKTGSAKGALQAMLKDLKGFGGITLAISVATTAMLLFGDKLFATKDKTKALKEEQDKLTESLDNYKNGLESVEKARLSGSQKAQKELLDLRLLKTIVEDNTRSTYEREGALKKLRDLYPNYLKNLSDEKILNGGLSTVYDKVTTSIIKRAKATAATNQIVKNSEDLLNLESQLAAEKSNLIKLEKDYNKVLTQTARSAGVVNAIQTGSGVNSAREKASKAVTDQMKLVDSLTGKIQNLELTNIDLEQGIDITASIDVENIKGIDPKKIDTSAFDAAASAIKLKIQEINSAYSDTSLGYDKRLGLLAQSFTKESELIALNTQNRLNNIKTSGEKEATILNEAETAKLKLIEKYNGLGAAQAKTYVADRLSQISTNSAIQLKVEEDAIINKYKALGDLTKEQEAQRNKELSDLKISSFNENIAAENAFLQQLLSNQDIQGQLRLDLEKRIQENLAKLRSEGLSKFSKDVKDTIDIGSALRSGISQAVSGLGEALASGAGIMSALGDVLLRAVAQIAINLGQQAIAIGTAMLAIKSAFANPFAAIAAGIALVALGSFINSSVSKTTSGFGSGSSGSSGSSRGSNIGTNAGGTSNVSSGSSFGSSSSFGSGSGNVVFEIQGTKLVGVLNNTLKQNRSLSGTLSIS